MPIGIKDRERVGCEAHEDAPKTWRECLDCDEADQIARYGKVVVGRRKTRWA